MKLVKTAIAAGLLSVGMTAMANLSVGIVNMQNVFVQAPQGQATVQTIKDQLAPQIDKLKSEQASLSTAMARFNRNAPTMTAKDRAAQEQQLSMQQQQFQQDVNNLKDTEGSKQQTAAAAFQSALVSAIGQVAKSGNYDMILTDQTVPYYKSAYDVTSQVVAIMSKSSGSSN
jgi:outer membrane protein